MVFLWPELERYKEVPETEAMLVEMCAAGKLIMSWAQSSCASLQRSWAPSQMLSDKKSTQTSNQQSDPLLQREENSEKDIRISELLA